jgi:hypothetical protein
MQSNDLKSIVNSTPIMAVITQPITGVLHTVVL